MDEAEVLRVRTKRRRSSATPPPPRSDGLLGRLRQAVGWMLSPTSPSASTPSLTPVVARSPTASPRRVTRKPSPPEEEASPIDVIAMQARRGTLTPADRRRLRSLLSSPDIDDDDDNHEHDKRPSKKRRVAVNAPQQDDENEESRSQLELQEDVARAPLNGRRGIVSPVPQRPPHAPPSPIDVVRSLLARAPLPSPSLPIDRTETPFTPRRVVAARSPSLWASARRTSVATPFAPVKRHRGADDSPVRAALHSPTSLSEPQQDRKRRMLAPGVGSSPSVRVASYTAKRILESLNELSSPIVEAVRITPIEQHTSPSPTPTTSATSSAGPSSRLSFTPRPKRSKRDKQRALEIVPRSGLSSVAVETPHARRKPRSSLAVTPTPSSPFVVSTRPHAMPTSGQAAENDKKDKEQNEKQEEEEVQFAVPTSTSVGRKHSKPTTPNGESTPSFPKAEAPSPTSSLAKTSSQASFSFAISSSPKDGGDIGTPLSNSSPLTSPLTKTDTFSTGSMFSFDKKSDDDQAKEDEKETMSASVPPFGGDITFGGPAPPPKSSPSVFGSPSSASSNLALGEKTTDTAGSNVDKDVGKTSSSLFGGSKSFSFSSSTTSPVSFGRTSPKASTDSKGEDGKGEAPSNTPLSFGFGAPAAPASSSFSFLTQNKTTPENLRTTAKEEVEEEEQKEEEIEAPKTDQERKRGALSALEKRADKEESSAADGSDGAIKFDAPSLSTPFRFRNEDAETEKNDTGTDKKNQSSPVSSHVSSSPTSFGFGTATDDKPPLVREPAALDQKDDAPGAPATNQENAQTSTATSSQEDEPGSPPKQDDQSSPTEAKESDNACSISAFPVGTSPSLVTAAGGTPSSPSPSTSMFSFGVAPSLGKSSKVADTAEGAKEAKTAETSKKDAPLGDQQTASTFSFGFGAAPPSSSFSFTSSPSSSSTPSSTSAPSSSEPLFSAPPPAVKRSRDDGSSALTTSRGAEAATGFSFAPADTTSGDAPLKFNFGGVSSGEKAAFTFSAPSSSPSSSFTAPSPAALSTSSDGFSFSAPSSAAPSSAAASFSFTAPSTDALSSSTSTNTSTTSTSNSTSTSTSTNFFSAAPSSPAPFSFSAPQADTPSSGNSASFSFSAPTTPGGGGGFFSSPAPSSSTPSASSPFPFSKDAPSSSSATASSSTQLSSGGFNFGSTSTPSSGSFNFSAPSPSTPSAVFSNPATNSSSGIGSGDSFFSANPAPATSTPAFNFAAPSTPSGGGSGFNFGGGNSSGAGSGFNFSSPATPTAAGEQGVPKASAEELARRGIRKARRKHLRK